MNKHIKSSAAIIAVGTEVTSGQIYNSHANWIARNLDDHHINTVLHMAVPDEAQLILQALQFASDQAKFIFITGGLGPTSDDITRNILSQWLNKELIFDESIWSELQTRLSERQVKISPSHRNQCYFPTGSTILKNRVGSAHGFYLEFKNLHIWTLPGPTNELHAIWSDHIESQIKKMSPDKTSTLRKWKCIGLPESEAADLVEEIVKGSNLKTGYRITGPYVEVKVWISSQIKEDEEKIYIDKINEVLKENVISVDDADIAFDFLNAAFISGPLTIIDECTNGVLSERLYKCWRDNIKLQPYSIRTLSSSHPDLKEINFEGPGTVLKLTQSNTPMNWKLTLNRQNSNLESELQFESKAKVYNEKFNRVKTELSLKRAFELIKSHKSC